MSDTIEIPTDVPTTDVPTPEYLFDVDTLVSEHDLLLKKEAEDRALANTAEFPDMVAFKAKLVEWASNGFPDAYPVFTLTLNPPAVCSDGVTREFFAYAEFLTGSTVANSMRRFSDKLRGMNLEYSFSQNTTTFHIYKSE